MQSKIVGLVEIPKIFGVPNPDGPPGSTTPPAAGKIGLRSEPNIKSKIVSELQTSKDVHSREHGYEEESAVAFSVKDGWYLLKSTKGMGWLSPADAGKFRGHEELIKTGLAYLNANWDKRIWADPSNQAKFEKIQLDPQERGSYESWKISLADVRILESKTIDGKLWFKAQIVSGRCDVEEKLGKTGWIPAYSEQNEMNLWFYSRGC